jgi:putative oxidoreductase
MCWEKLEKYRDAGFLILRVGIGGMFMYYGYGKLAGGAQMWEMVGSAMGSFGINFAPQFFGLLASLIEFVGGLCLILGLCFRPASLLLFLVMFVAVVMHLKKGDGLQGAAHAIDLGIVFLSLLFIGPGAKNLDDKIKSCCKKI